MPSLWAERNEATGYERVSEDQSLALCKLIEPCAGPLLPLDRPVNYRVGLFVRVPEGLTDSIC